MARLGWEEDHFAMRCGGCKVEGMIVKKGEKSFRHRVEYGWGGEVVGEYNGTNTPVECKCSKGHPCSPRPNSIQQGQGLCKTCAGNDPETVKVEIHSALTLHKWVIVNGYVNKNTSLSLTCPKNHTRDYSAKQIRYHIICRICDPTGSKGALKLQKAISSIFNEEFDGETRLSELRPLKYDYTAFYKGPSGTGHTILMEFHGAQHNKHIPFFHETYEEFADQRQHDLIKRKIVDILPDSYRYISFSHKWVDRPVDDFTQRLRNFLDSDEPCSIDAESEWLMEEPEELTWEEYYTDK